MKVQRSQPLKAELIWPHPSLAGIAGSVMTGPASLMFGALTLGLGSRFLKLRQESLACDPPR